MVELMVVIAIVGVLVEIGPKLYVQVRRFFFLNSARIELQRDARTNMELMTRRIRQAKSATVTVDQMAGQPYLSRLSFTDIEGRWNSYYQNGQNLMMVVNASTSTLSQNLRYLSFAVPRSDDMSIVSVSLTFQKSIYDGQVKALHMASQKVRVMN